MMQRIPEPVLMVGKDQCYEFATAHALRAHVRYAFVEWLFAKIPMHWNIADIGCGSGFPIANYLIEKMKENTMKIIKRKLK